MAKRTSASTAVTKRTAAQTRPKARASAPSRGGAPSAAVKCLGRLPALDPKLRLAFRSSFTDAQCEAWGQRTEAAKVLAEAVRCLSPLEAAVNAGSVAGYSARRLTFLAELLVALEDELAATSQPEAIAHRGARESAVAYAKGVRRELIDRLGLVAGGRAELLEALLGRDEGERSPEALRDSLAGLIELATRWRRDPVLEVLSDDADLTTARLGAAYNALEALAGADEVLRQVAPGEGDAGSVNRIEGRVLRELSLAFLCARRARESGVRLPALPLGPTLKKGFG